MFRLTNAALTLVSLSSPFVVTASDFTSCMVTASVGTISAQYDLSLLHKDFNYKVYDDRNTSDSSGKYAYTYTFNVCDQVYFEPIPGPSLTNWHDECVKADPPGTNSSAYQYYYDNGDITKPQCKSLGVFNTTTKNQGYALGNDIRGYDLSKGVSIVYTDGTHCRTNNQPRTFYVTVFCNPQGSNEPVKNTVHEDSNTRCVYEVTFSSPLGCPLACPSVTQPGKGSQICGGHGICGNDQNGPRCFCNPGWNGDDCTKTDEEVSEASCTGVCVGLIFVLILLIILLIGGSIIYYRVHKLSTMNITFSALTESFATNAGVENRADDEDDGGDVSMHTKNPIRTAHGSHAAPSSSDFVVDDLND